MTPTPLNQGEDAWLDARRALEETPIIIDGKNPEEAILFDDALSELTDYKKELRENGDYSPADYTKYDEAMRNSLRHHIEESRKRREKVGVPLPSKTSPANPEIEISPIPETYPETSPETAPPEAARKTDSTKDTDLQKLLLIAEAVRVSGKERKRDNEVCNPEKAKLYVQGFEHPQIWAARIESVRAAIEQAKNNPRFGKGRKIEGQPNEYAVYQWAKCGYPEFRIKNPWFSLRPEADGVSPDNCPQEPWLGCLILEAKYSASNSDNYSYYGYGSKRPPNDPAFSMEAHIKHTFPKEIGNIIDLMNWKVTDEMLEADEKRSDDKWERARVKVAQQMALYYLVCLEADIPYNDFVVIYSKPFMYNYFRKLVPCHPGHLIKEATTIDDGMVWGTGYL